MLWGDLASGATGGLSITRFPQSTVSRGVCSTRGETKNVRALGRLLQPFWDLPPSHPPSPSVCHPSCPCCCRASASARWVSLPSEHTTVRSGNGSVGQLHGDAGRFAEQNRSLFAKCKASDHFSFSVLSKRFPGPLARAPALLLWICADLLPALLRAIFRIPGSPVF